MILNNNHTNNCFSMEKRRGKHRPNEIGFINSKEYLCTRDLDAKTAENHI